MTPTDEARASLFVVILASEIEDPRGERLSAALRELTKIVPEDRILPVVLEQNRPWWEKQLSRLPKDNIVEEPLFRGSGCGLLHAVLRVLIRAPSAEWLIVSLDAFQGLSELSLREGLEQARSSGRAQVRELVHLGTGHRSLLSMIATTSSLLRLFREAQGGTYRAFIEHLGAARAVDPSALDGLYPFLPWIDLVPDILDRAPEEIRNLEERGAA